MSRQELIERLAGAFRERDVFGQIKSDPAFRDLDAPARQEAYEAALSSRRLEAALDPEALSSTAHAVMARIPRN
ncbi:MAG: hypothetical protein ACI9WU_002019 [Myxococcota bacterium]|jgi:hypothetical protein